MKRPVKVWAPRMDSSGAGPSRQGDANENPSGGGASAQRRRFTLRFADYRRQGRMTVSRRELPRSRSEGPGSEDALSHRSLEGSPFVAPLRRGSDTAVIVLRHLGGHERPDKATELPGDGRHGHRGAFAAPDEPGVALVQPQVRLSDLHHDLGRLVSQERAQKRSRGVSWRSGHAFEPTMRVRGPRAGGCRYAQAA